jgi:hypothetical protein
MGPLPVLHPRTQRPPGHSALLPHVSHVSAVAHTSQPSIVGSGEQPLAKHAAWPSNGGQVHAQVSGSRPNVHGGSVGAHSHRQVSGLRVLLPSHAGRSTRHSHAQVSGSRLLRSGQGEVSAHAQTPVTSSHVRSAAQQRTPPSGCGQARVGSAAHAWQSPSPCAASPTQRSRSGPGGKTA